MHRNISKNIVVSNRNVASKIYQPSKRNLHYGQTAALAHQDHVPMADPDAGYLGVPFTQKENEEEWMDMLDWAKIEAEFGGSSTD